MPLLPSRVSHLIIDDMADSQDLVLCDISGQRRLSIAIGTHEALAIQRALNGEHFPRPLTHDLCAGLIMRLGFTADAVHITDCDQGTFHAQVIMVPTAAAASSEPRSIDARPSDAIAIALRCPGCSLMVNDELYASYNDPQLDDSDELDDDADDEAYVDDDEPDDSDDDGFP